MPAGGSTPDYADPAAWFSLSDDAGAAALADLFYVHPTTFQGPEWNQPWPDQATYAATLHGAVMRQAGVFAPYCRVHAPRYRQAGSLAFRQPGDRAEAAYELAYSDVLAAFRQFLQLSHRGRLILCGHSQGALHVGRLLAEVIEPEGLAPDLIAAYAIGIGFSEGLFGARFRQVPPGTHPRQTGCLISWNCFVDGSDASGFLVRTIARDAAWLSGRVPGLPICLNPISFDAGVPAVAAAENPGSLPGSAGQGARPALMPGLAGARVADGVAWVSPALPPAWGLNPLPGGNLHLHDIALFFASLRQDGQRRCAAHLAARAI